MWTIASGLWDNSSFIPHGHCYLWQPELVWLHLLADLAIAIAYYSIPLILIYFIRQRQDIPFNWIFLLFGAFIVACGTTHLMDIWTLWHPTYWLSGGIKIITALISLYTALALILVLPRLLALPSLAREMAERLKLLDVLDASLNEIYMFDPQTLRLEYVNAGAARNIGYSVEEMCSLTVPDIETELDAAACHLLVAPLQRHEQERLKIETCHRRADGSTYPVESYLQLIEQKGKSVFLAVITDITERKRTELALREQAEREHLMRAIAQKIHQSLSLKDVLDTTVAEVRHLLQADRVLVHQFALNRSGTIVAESVSAGWTSALGCSIEDACFGTDSEYLRDKKRAIADIAEAGLSQCYLDFLAQFEVKASLVVPILLHTEQGERSHSLWGLLIAHQCAAPRQWHAVQLDLLDQLGVQLAIAIQQASAFEQAQTELRERQQIEVRLRATLNEKEVLLKEIHHRVKNNLQIVSGLLQLQAQSLDNPQAIHALRESQNRVESMSLIHKKLYTTSDLGHIDASDYIQSLVANLSLAYQLTPGRITVQTNIEPVTLSLDQAIPCGLIVNELISNALKHAFPNQGRGEILVSLYPTQTNQLKLIIQDNGIGLPPNFDWRNTLSLGLSLVYDLATEQLDGTLSVEATQGTAFRIEFPVAHPFNPVPQL